jgi:MarR family 2-MHQ and catechol resistance regulon transcriptional repressor
MTTEELLAENPSYRVWWHLARARQAVAARLARFYEERGITGAQFGALRCVADAGDEGLMLSELSRHLMVTCGNTTGVVDRLEQAGLIRRARQPEDRRVVMAQLTDEGAQLYAELMPSVQLYLNELTGALTPEEKELLARCCGKLHESLEDARNSRSANGLPGISAGTTG